MVNLISKIVSKRTLDTNQLCSAIETGTLIIDDSPHWNKVLKFFYIPDTVFSSRAEAQELIEEFDDVYINEYTSDEANNEYSFIIGKEATIRIYYLEMVEMFT